MKREIRRAWLSLVTFGFVAGVVMGSLWTESNQGEAIAAGEQQIERFSDACQRSKTIGAQPAHCENITH